MKAIRWYVPRSKTWINLDSNKDNNDEKDDNDNDTNNDDNNSGNDNEDSDGGGDDDDDNDNGRNNFWYIGKYVIDSSLPLNSFTSETMFAHCTQYEDHGCRGVGISLRTNMKDFTKRNRGVKSIMSPYDQDNFSISFGSMSIRIYHSYSSNEPIIPIILVHMVLNNPGMRLAHPDERLARLTTQPK